MAVAAVALPQKGVDADEWRKGVDGGSTVRVEEEEESIGFGGGGGGGTSEPIGAPRAPQPKPPTLLGELR